MDEDSDRLKSGLAAGDEASYRQAYDLYGQSLFRTALRLSGHTSDAEDAVQEVFVALVRSRQHLPDVADLRAYLFASLRHTVGRLARRRQAQPRPGLDGNHLPAACESQPVDEAERLWRTVKRLPEEQGEVLTMKLQGELTFAQIAAVLGISPNTAASRYRYGLEKLKRMLEGEE